MFPNKSCFVGYKNLDGNNMTYHISQFQSDQNVFYEYKSNGIIIKGFSFYAENAMMIPLVNVKKFFLIDSIIYVN